MLEVRTQEGWHTVNTMKLKRAKSLESLSFHISKN